MSIHIGRDSAAKQSKSGSDWGHWPVDAVAHHTVGHSVHLQPCHMTSSPSFSILFIYSFLQLPHFIFKIIIYLAFFTSHSKRSNHSIPNKLLGHASPHLPTYPWATKPPTSRLLPVGNLWGSSRRCISLASCTKAHVLIISQRTKVCTRDKGVEAVGEYIPPGDKYLYGNLLMFRWISVVADQYSLFQLDPRTWLTDWLTPPYLI